MDCASRPRWVTRSRGRRPARACASCRSSPRPPRARAARSRSPRARAPRRRSCRSVVTSPATSNSSLTAIGTPSSGRSIARQLAGAHRPGRPPFARVRRTRRGRRSAAGPSARCAPDRDRPARARRPHRRRSARPAWRYRRMRARSASMTQQSIEKLDTPAASLYDDRRRYGIAH